MSATAAHRRDAAPVDSCPPRRGRRRRRGGSEHLHPELAVLAAAAAPVDPDGPGDLAVVLLRHAAGVRRLPPADQQALADIALAGLALEAPADHHHVDLPSGTCAQVSAREIPAPSPTPSP